MFGKLLLTLFESQSNNKHTNTARHAKLVSLMERMREEKGREAVIEYVARLRKLAESTIKVEDGLRNLKIRGSDE